MAAEQKAHAEDTKTVAPLAREVDDTLGGCCAQGRRL